MQSHDPPRALSLQNREGSNSAWELAEEKERLAMKPFDDYPKGGREKLGLRTGSNCRRGYGLRLQQVTGQTKCAYCGLSLVDAYEHWLLMAVDHVIPTKAGREIGIRDEWLADWANCVLSCSACNGFRNRFRFPAGKCAPPSWEEFVRLRDDCFRDRKEEITPAGEADQNFFARKSWAERRSSF
jgi:hypothetical protein